MIKIITFLIVTFLTAQGLDGWEFGNNPPVNLVYRKFSPDNLTSVSFYESSEEVREGEHKKQYMRIDSLTDSTWLSSPSDLIIEKIEFIDNHRLLIQQGSSTASVSSVFNIVSKERKILGGGSAEYIKEGKNAGLFLLHDRKGYLSSEGGAFWYDILVDGEGAIVYIVSKPSKYSVCVPISKILDFKVRNYPKLKQSHQDCIYVSI